MYYFDYQFVFKTTVKVKLLQKSLKKLPLEPNLATKFSKLVDELIEDFTSEANSRGMYCNHTFLHKYPSKYPFPLF